ALVLFESGAIVPHIAERHAGLLPDDASARARAVTWMFAALNTVEPPILDLQTTRFLEGDKPWCMQRGRPDDGGGAAQVESIGYSGRISKALCLCRPWRSAARLQACFRRSI